MGRRMKVLFGERRAQTLATLAALLIAGAIVIGSGANFTATSFNPDNTFSAATFQINNDKEAQKLIDVSTMKPGDSAGPVTVDIQLDSDVPGSVTLTLDNVRDTFPGGGAALSALLLVTVRDVTRGVDIYSDSALTTQTWALPGTGGADWAAGETHQFSVTVRWPNGAPAVDNPRKNASTLFDLTWNAAQS